jgi:hypothetical protein
MPGSATRADALDHVVVVLFETRSLVLGKALGCLGQDIGLGIIERTRQMGVELPRQLDVPFTGLTPQLIVEVIRDVAVHHFPRLAPAGAGDGH